MDIDVISFWYNEGFLAPLFLDHYAYASNIHIILDNDTDDGTMDAIKAYDGPIRVSPFVFTDGMNTKLKQDAVNAAYHDCRGGWVLLVDADEFVYKPDMGEILRSEADAFFVQFYQVYRNKNDVDITYETPAWTQRLHGDPDITGNLNRLYRKPVLVRSGLDISWSPGCHSLSGRVQFDPYCMRGAHWAMADPCFCVDRRLSRRKRQSAFNRAHGMGWHNWDVTREGLIAECKSREGCPKVLPE